MRTRDRTLTYAQALERAKRVGQYLLDKELSAERPLVVLSGNDIEHALLHLGAMYVGVPYAPISPAYSLLSTDFAKLRTIFELLTPGLAFVCSPGALFKKALEVVKCEVIHRLEEPLATPAVDEAHARVGPDTIVKFLFTSGSTGMPKAVINTQRMWCSNQAMIQSMLPFFCEEPPVLVDWAPWHHTAAGNHDLGLVLYNGGSYHIDDGKPLPGAIEATVRALRDGRADLVLQRAEGLRGAAAVPAARGSALPFLFPIESPLVRRRRAAAACLRRDEGARLPHLRRRHPVPHRVRRHRDGADGARPHLAFGERGEHGVSRRRAPS